MASNNYYSILGIRADATADEIREAYIVQAKRQHPDHFDPLRQPEEWRLANERLRELNEAYAHLRREAAARKTGRPRSAATPPPEPRRAPPRPPPPPPQTFSLGPLRAGIAFWDSMTPALRTRLKARQAGKFTPQFSAVMQNSRLNLVFAILAGLWLIYLLATVRLALWTDTENTVYVCASILAAGIGGWNLLRLLRFHSCELTNGVLITPLYLVRITYDQVRYYPIWEVREFNKRELKWLWRYWGTVMELKFQAGEEKFRLRSRSQAAAFSEALRRFNEKIQTAKITKDVSYFAQEDDFRDHPPQDTKLRQLGVPALVAWPVLTLGVFIGGTVGLETYNDELHRTGSQFAVNVDSVGSTSTTGQKFVGAGGTVDFQTDPTGAVVQENGAFLGRTPLHLTSLAPTPHKYVLRYADWAPVDCSVDLTAGIPRVVKYSWPHGAIHVDTTPEGAHVSMNGQELGVTPLVLAAVPPGHVDYAVSLDGYAPVELVGDVADKRTLVLSAKLVDTLHQGSIRLALLADRHQVLVTNQGDKPITILKANLYDADYTLKDTIDGPWAVAPGAGVTLTFNQPRSDFDFYSFQTEPKNLAVQIVK